MAKRICVIDGCGKYRAGRGWCLEHWMRWKAHGDPLAGRPSHVGKAIDWPDGTRSCTSCEQRQSLEAFDKVQNATLGRRSDCKACRSAQMKGRYSARRDELRLASKARRDAARAVKAAANPAYYLELDRQQAARRDPAWTPIDKSSERRRARLAVTGRDHTVTRSNLRNQYGDECFYCGTVMTFLRTPKGQRFPSDLATIEHVVPISAGGTHTWDNVVLACRTCNCKKRHTPLAVWLERQAISS